MLHVSAYTYAIFRCVNRKYTKERILKMKEASLYTDCKKGSRCKDMIFLASNDGNRFCFRNAVIFFVRLIENPGPGVA